VRLAISDQVDTHSVVKTGRQDQQDALAFVQPIDDLLHGFLAAPNQAAARLPNRHDLLLSVCRFPCLNDRLRRRF
jgi:hypothetical protein